jgi:hypothetical protein
MMPAIPKPMAMPVTAATAMPVASVAMPVAATAAAMPVGHRVRGAEQSRATDNRSPKRQQFKIHNYKPPNS